jgi:hypothetical protein
MQTADFFAMKLNSKSQIKDCQVFFLPDKPLLL